MQNLAVQITSIVVLIILVLILGCITSVRRKVPINYILLAGVTLCESACVCSLTASLEPETTLLALGVCSLTVIILFLAAWSTPATPKLLIYLLIGLVIALIVQLITGIVLLFTGFISSGWMMAYGILGAFVSGIYIIFDFWLILTPEAMDMDDYILGSMMLYIDIIRMLVYIIIIFTSNK